MKNRGYLYLSAFVAFILVIGLACSFGGPSTPVAPAPQPINNTGNNQQPVEPSNNSGSGDLVTFTDKNKYYQIDVPSDWKHEQSEDTTNNYYYIDTFTSPDENALIENIAYDDGTAFPGGQNGQFALQILHEFYSDTGKEGDIKITDDAVQKDGSERLTWNSKGGGYTGISFFEVRNRTTFLMFTVEYVNEYEDQYLDLLNNVISSYIVP